MSLYSTKISNHVQINLEFEEGLSTAEVVERISQLSHPQVVVWYIGANGLRKAGAQFYKDFLFSPILHRNPQVSFWLYDLTAWDAFKNPNSTIQNKSSCCAAIESFSIPHLKCIASAKIFQKMQEITDHDLIQYFRKALQREFISASSEKVPNRNIRVRELFSSSCPIIAEWYDYDVAKAYSIFQYLEGCLLVDEIFVNQPKPHNIEIVFALPNDELKYYLDKHNSFQNDIDVLIEKKYKTQNLEHIDVKIKFLAFNFSSQSHHRPYNAPGIVLKGNNLTYKDIIRNNENEENANNYFISGDLYATKSKL